jgi:hypothetical protein
MLKKLLTKTPPDLPCLPAGRLYQREETNNPPLVKGEKGRFS